MFFKIKNEILKKKYLVIELDWGPKVDTIGTIDLWTLVTEHTNRKLMKSLRSPETKFVTDFDKKNRTNTFSKMKKKYLVLQL